MHKSLPSMDFLSSSSVKDTGSELLFEIIVRHIVVIGVLFIPLFFLPWTSDFLDYQKQTLLIVLSGFGLVVWLLGVIKEGKIRTISTSLGLPILVLIIAIFLAALFSVENFRSFFGIGGVVSDSFATWLSMAVFLFLLISTMRRRSAYLLRVLTLSSFVALLFATLQVLGLTILPFSFLAQKSFNTIGTLNSVGMYAAIILPLLIGMKLKGTIIWKVIHGGSIALSLFLLILINWWVLWTVVIFGMIMLVSMRSFNQGFKPSRFVLPMTIIVVSVFLIITGLNLGGLKSGLPTEVSPSHSLSFDVIKKVVKEKPIFGYGPSNFRFAYDKFGSQALAGTLFSDIRFNRGTSEIQTFIVNNGIIGTLALLFFIYSIAVLLFKSFWNSQIADKAGLSSAVGASLTSAIVAFILFSFNFTLMFLFWVILALFVLRVESVSRKFDVSIENSPRYSLISSVAFILGLIIVLSGSYYSVTRYIADLKFTVVASSETTDEAINNIVEAININPSDSRYYRTGSNILLVRINEELNKEEQDPIATQNFVQAVLDVSKRATDRNPHDSSNWLQRGIVHQNLSGVVSGVEDLAITYYKEALLRNPENPSVLNSIGETYLVISNNNLLLAQNQRDQVDRDRFITLSNESLRLAQESFLKATEINSNFGRALYNLGIAYDRLGQLDDSIIQLERLIPFNADNPGLAFELGLLYYRVDRKDEAFTQISRAVDLSPNYSNALWFLSLIHEERGDIDLSIDGLERILVNNPDNQIVLQKVDDLKNGITTIPPNRITDQPPL